ncbi:hypothetical protein ACTNDS_12925 [Blautia sp. HCP3S3_C12]
MTEHEELLMLRELAAKQKQQLEEKDRIIEEKMRRWKNRISRLKI